jgi:hypothetical protein
MINVLKDLETARKAFMEMEGLELTERYGWTDLSKREVLPFEEPDDVVATIYGNGGLNRYMLFVDGELQFSGLHAGSWDIPKAKELGFNIF